MRWVIALVLATGVMASAADVVWDNGEPPAEWTLYFSQFDEVFPFVAQVADDFRLDEQQALARPVRLFGVDWFGGWVSPSGPPAVGAFRVLLYADAGGEPTGGGMADPTPTALVMEEWPLDDVEYVPWGSDLWAYRVGLVAPEFLVQPDVRYWVVVQAVNTFPPKWGWCSSRDAIHGAAAVQGFPDMNVPFWTHLPEDMSFVLHGQEIQAGDVNCDEVIDFGDINPFVLALSDPVGYAQRYPLCARSTADINEDGRVDFADINPFVTLLSSPGPHIGGFHHSGCLPGVFPPCGGDEVRFEVEGRTVRVVHEGATYNCCLDDITYKIEVKGSRLELKEVEEVTQPCYCICCYDSEVRVVDLKPGRYVVELCWEDYETNATWCEEEEIEIR